MRVYHFSEQAYHPAWNEHSGTLRVTFVTAIRSGSKRA